MSKHEKEEPKELHNRNSYRTTAFVTVLVTLDLFVLVVYRSLVGVDVVFAGMCGAWWACALMWMNIMQIKGLKQIWKRQSIDKKKETRNEDNARVPG